MKKKNLSFCDIYKYETEKPTPRQTFISEIARVTGAAETTVKQWANGVQLPNMSAMKLLCAHFNCDPETLFPTLNKTAQQS